MHKVCPLYLFLGQCWQGSELKCCVLLSPILTLFDRLRSALDYYFFWMYLNTVLVLYLSSYLSTIYFLSAWLLTSPPTFPSLSSILCIAKLTRGLWESALQVFLSTRSYNKPWMSVVKMWTQTHTSHTLRDATPHTQQAHSITSNPVWHTHTHTC